jgi:Ca-activated chloride channel homolog
MKRFLYLSLSIVVIVTALSLPGTAYTQNGVSGNRFADTHSDGTADNLLKIDSNLVLINVSVQDDKRNFVPTLGKYDFRVFDDQVEQNIEVFSKENVPVSFGIVIDTSGSMRHKLNRVITAANRLLDICRPGDEVFIVDMKDSIRIRFVQPYTTNIEEARCKLANMYSSGGTALLDGIREAGKYAHEHATNHRRALIVMSDGDERDSTIRSGDLIDNLRELDLQIYLVGFPEGAIDSDGIFMEASSRKAKNLMKKLAEESGGQAFFPHSLDEINLIADKIGNELRSQYMIGYYPNNDRSDERWHKLQVKLTDKKRKYSVRTRSGYYSKNSRKM